MSQFGNWRPRVSPESSHTRCRPVTCEDFRLALRHRRPRRHHCRRQPCRKSHCLTHRHRHRLRHCLRRHRLRLRHRHPLHRHRLRLRLRHRHRLCLRLRLHHQLQCRRHQGKVQKSRRSTLGGQMLAANRSPCLFTSTPLRLLTGLLFRSSSAPTFSVTRWCLRIGALRRSSPGLGSMVFT